VDIETICAKMRQVARLNENGLKSELRYQREITALRAQLVSGRFGAWGCGGKRLVFLITGLNSKNDETARGVNRYLVGLF
jgi:hypothetical protein